MIAPMWTFLSAAAVAADAPQVMADAAPAAAPGGMFEMLMPLAIVVVIMYFLVFRPQQQELKAHEAMIASLVKGDAVVTSGGLFGVVHEVQEGFVVVEIAEKVRVKIEKGSIKRKNVPAAAAAAPSKEA